MGGGFIGAVRFGGMMRDLDGEHVTDLIWLVVSWGADRLYRLFGFSNDKN